MVGFEHQFDHFGSRQPQGGAPVVEMVDNFVHNRRLASLYEGRVGEGKLMLATFDLQTALDKRPVARQMPLLYPELHEQRGICSHSVGRTG